MPVTRFVAPGPGRAHADADLAGDAGVAVGGVGAALLVADEDVADLGVVAEDVVERQDHAARVAEEDVDALADERLADDVGPDPGPAPRPRVVEHRLAGPLDGGRARPSRRPARASDARRDSAVWPTPLSSVSSLVSRSVSCVGQQKTPASRRGSLRSSVVAAPSARPSEFLRSPAGSR